MSESDARGEDDLGRREAKLMCDGFVNASSISYFYDKRLKRDLPFALIGTLKYSIINLYYVVILF